MAASGFSENRATVRARSSSGDAGHDVAVAGLGPRRNHADGDQPVVGPRRGERRRRRSAGRPRASPMAQSAWSDSTSASGSRRCASQVAQMSAGAVDAARGSTRIVLGRETEQRAEPAGERLAGHDQDALARDQAGRAARRLLRRSSRRPRAGAVASGCRGVLSGQKRVPEPPGQEDGPAHQSSVGQRRAMLAQIEEQGADVGVGRGENREPVARAGARQHQQPAGVLEHRRGELAPRRRPGRGGRRAGRVWRRAPPPSPNRTRRGRRARSGGRRRSSSSTASTPARPARLWTTSPNSIMGSNSGAGETLRNVGAVPVEVKKRTAVDPSLRGP